MAPASAIGGVSTVRLPTNAATIASAPARTRVAWETVAAPVTVEVAATVPARSWVVAPAMVSTMVRLRSIVTEVPA